jgi:hypothetical protein
MRASRSAKAWASRRKRRAAMRHRAERQMVPRPQADEIVRAGTAAPHVPCWLAATRVPRSRLDGREAAAGVLRPPNSGTPRRGSVAPPRSAPPGPPRVGAGGNLSRGVSSCSSSRRRPGPRAPSPERSGMSPCALAVAKLDPPTHSFGAVTWVPPSGGMTVVGGALELPAATAASRIPARRPGGSRGRDNALLRRPG